LFIVSFIQGFAGTKHKEERKGGNTKPRNREKK